MPKSGGKAVGVLLLDANVLIDYLKTSESILTLVSEHLGNVYVPSVVVDEVRKGQHFDDSDCDRLNIQVVDPTTAMLIEAQSMAWSNPSLADKVCFVMCKRRGWTCVTNDKSVRKRCDAEGVKVLWGLQLMLRLIECGALSSDDAINVAKEIKNLNPFMVQATVDTFTQKAKSAKLRDL